MVYKLSQPHTPSEFFLFNSSCPLSSHLLTIRHQEQRTFFFILFFSYHLLFRFSPLKYPKKFHSNLYSESGVITAIAPRMHVCYCRKKIFLAFTHSFVLVSQPNWVHMQQNTNNPSASFPCHFFTTSLTIFLCL